MFSNKNERDIQLSRSVHPFAPWVVIKEEDSWVREFFIDFSMSTSLRPEDVCLTRISIDEIDGETSVFFDISIGDVLIPVELKSRLFSESSYMYENYRVVTDHGSVIFRIKNIKNLEEFKGKSVANTSLQILPTRIFFLTGVKKMRFCRIDGTSFEMTGDIVFDDGLNTEVDVNTETNTVTFSVKPTVLEKNKSQESLCGEPSFSISEATPDSNGNIEIIGDGFSVINDQDRANIIIQNPIGSTSVC